jgi:acyl dehydratase
LIEGIPYHIDNYPHYIGKPIGVSDWFCIDQSRIDAFAAATVDMNRLHVDPAWAKQHSPYGGVIAHGFLTLSLMTHLSTSAEMMPDGIDYGINVGFDRMRFLAPVPSGAHIRMRAALLECDPKGPGKWAFRSRCSIDVRETNKTAVAAIWSVLFINTALMEAAKGSAAGLDLGEGS